MAHTNPERECCGTLHGSHHRNTCSTQSKTKFPPGQVVATHGAIDLMGSYNTNPVEILNRHQAGDWGKICLADQHVNNQALIHGNRILSVYAVGGQDLWVITEADRSVTTILLPGEY